MRDRSEAEEPALEAVEQMELDVGRVLDLSTVQTCKFPVVLAYRDFTYQGNRWFDDGTQFLAANPIQVVSSDGTRNIGYAVVTQDERRCLARVFLRRDCPERLDIENGTPIWPVASFRLLAEYPEQRMVQILRISLSNARPIDDRITPCGKPIL